MSGDFAVLLVNVILLSPAARTSGTVWLPGVVKDPVVPKVTEIAAPPLTLIWATRVAEPLVNATTIWYVPAPPAALTPLMVRVPVPVVCRPMCPTRAPLEHAVQAMTSAVPLRVLLVDSAWYDVEPPTTPTVSVNVTLWVAEAPVPVTVMGYVPVGVDDVVVTVRVEEPPAVTVAGLSDAVLPAGSPEGESVIDWAEPEVTAVLTVEVAV